MEAKDAKDAAATTLRDLGAFIREQRHGAELSLRNLATKAGVSNPYLSQIERGLRKPSAEILQSIARALTISAETLYVKAGFLEERDDDVIAAVLASDDLDQRSKDLLLDVYASLRTAQQTASDDDLDAAG